MTEEQAIKLIQKARSLETETREVEFKESQGGLPKDIWQAITAFAQIKGGGLIVFGVDRGDKKVIGLKNSVIRAYQTGKYPIL